MDNRSMPGIDSTGSRIPVPSMMNIGYIRSSTVNGFSRVSRLTKSSERFRRMRVLGKEALIVMIVVCSDFTAIVSASMSICTSFMDYWQLEYETTLRII